MKETTPRTPRDCYACRIVGSVGLVGIGGYLANCSFKQKTFASKYAISVCSFAFICLGIARYKQTYPFDKKPVEVMTSK